MRLGGIVVCLAIGCVSGPLAPAWSEDLHQELSHAEKELSKAAHTDPSHPDANTDPMSIDPDLAIWTFIVFLLLLAILWKFAWGPIGVGLAKREKSIADDIAAAQRQHEEAKALLAKYEARLAAAADEVRGMMEEARRDAEHAKQSILAEAKSGAEAERLRALREIESATDAALQSLAERSAKLAVELAGKIVQSSLTPGDHSRLIQEAVEKFPRAMSSQN